MRVVVKRQRRPPAVELDCSTVYDFLLSVAVVTIEPPHEFDAWEEWRGLTGEAGRAALDGLLRRAGDAEVLHRELAALMLLAIDGPRTAADFLETLARLPAEELAARMLRLADCDEREPPEAAHVEAALTGERSAATALLSRLSGDIRRRAALWLADPVAAQVDLTAGLRAWHESVYAVQEERQRAIIERDAAARMRSAEQRGLEEVLATIGGTLQFSFVPAIRRVIVAPAVVARPAIIFSPEDTVAGMQVVVYPVADESLAAPEDLAPPRPLLRLYKALGDETRLKILRLLVQEELYATEIAERLGLAKATVSHHMVLLRAAGLVEVRGQRKIEQYYRLHRENLDAPSRLLKRYLGQ
jgi:DNA-binding transcriptional ArsR family regulator